MNSVMDVQTTIEAGKNRATKLYSFEETIHYPESHADDMGESSFHYKVISYLFSVLDSYLANRNDVTVAANMNLYYEEGNPRNYYTPDVMIAFGAEKRDRQVYKLWEDNVFPQVVFEIASQRTWKNDIGEKSEFYASFGVKEYYLIDAERRYLPLPLMAYRREEERLRYIPLEENRIFSPLLKLEIVDTGKSFRLFDPAEQKFLQAVLTGEE
jgi:Uma2 family endonuclease